MARYTLQETSPMVRLWLDNNGRGITRLMATVGVSTYTIAEFQDNNKQLLLFTEHNMRQIGIEYVRMTHTTERVDL